MKVKILATLLAISVLLNIAGLIFFACYIKLGRSYKAIRKERNLMAQSLNAVRNYALNSNDSSSSTGVVKRTFFSLSDGQEDTYAIAPPRTNPSRTNTLIVYLHGMGSSYLEPFVAPTSFPVANAIQDKYPEMCLLSCSYRKDASWGNDAAIADITQNIREVLQQYRIERIVLVGTSMGACTSLLYATCAPGDIKEKIRGVVCVEGAGNLKDLYELTGNVAVRIAMSAAFGGNYNQVPGVYARKSFLSNLNSMGRDVRVAVVSANSDKVVPPELQKEVVNALTAENRPNRLINIDGTHGAPPANVYLEALDFALGNG